MFRFDDGQVQSLAVVCFEPRRLVTGGGGTFRRIRACYDEEKATLPVESLPYIAVQISMIRKSVQRFSEKIMLKTARN